LVIFRWEGMSLALHSVSGFASGIFFFGELVLALLRGEGCGPVIGDVGAGEGLVKKSVIRIDQTEKRSY
jgi:hypothetical protein